MRWSKENKTGYQFGGALQEACKIIYTQIDRRETVLAEDM